MRKIFILLLILCALVSVLTACGKEEEEKTPLTAAQAIEIVLKDTGLDVLDAQPHVHNGEYQGTECFMIYITVEGESVSYAVDLYSGEILNVSHAEHFH